MDFIICLTVPMKMSKETALSMLINIIHIIPTCPNSVEFCKSKNVKLARFIICIFELFDKANSENQREKKEEEKRKEKKKKERKKLRFSLIYL